MDAMATQESTVNLLELLAQLRAITEDKIEATLARDPVRLERLLVAEAPPLLAFRRLAPRAAGLPAPAQAALVQAVRQWQQRTQHLQQLLETQLGYVDFARFVLGVRPTAHRVDESV